MEETPQRSMRVRVRDTLFIPLQQWMQEPTSATHNKKVLPRNTEVFECMRVTGHK